MNITFQTLPAQTQHPLMQPPFQEWADTDGAAWALFFRCGRDYLIRFPNLADFDVSSDGQTVVARPAPGVSAGTIEHLHLNQVLPLALSRQGRLVLHASAVAINTFGVAFTGVSGRGKSTLAASFATTGSKLLTDDGLQLQWMNGQCQITPSHRSVRLWADSEEALIHGTAETAPAVDYTAKTRLLAGDGLAFCDQARPLRRVYFLGEGLASSPSIQEVRPAEALVELVKNSFLLDVEEQRLLAWHFEEMVRLSALPIYYRLDYPRHYEALPFVRNAIIEHVTASGEVER